MCLLADKGMIILLSFRSGLGVTQRRTKCEGKKERGERKDNHNHSHMTGQKHKPTHTVEKRDAGDFSIMKANLDRIVHVIHDNVAQLTHRLESEGVLTRGAVGRTSAVPSLASVSGWGRASVRPVVSSSKDGMQFEGLLSTLCPSRESLLDTPRVWRTRYSIHSIYL